MSALVSFLEPLVMLPALIRLVKHVHATTSVEAIAIGVIRRTPNSNLCDLEGPLCAFSYGQLTLLLKGDALVPPLEALPSLRCVLDIAASVDMVLKLAPTLTDLNVSLNIPDVAPLLSQFTKVTRLDLKSPRRARNSVRTTGRLADRLRPEEWTRIHAGR
jgi:hypothetical protein